jgi:predicted PurR-regulated permease PerM
MSSDNTMESALTPKTLRDSMIRVGLIAFLAYSCARVFSPFLIIMLWGLILAIMLYPLQLKLANKLGGKQGRAASILVLICILVLGVPMAMLGSSFVDHINDTHTAFENNELVISQPDPSVAEWPLIGEKLHRGWSEAATNLPQFVEKYSSEIKALSKKVVAAAKSTLGTMAMFLGAFIIAGIMMAWGDSGTNAMLRIYSRFAGPVKGPLLQTLSVGTVRSVANGVLGVAFIQAILLGLGFVVADIPAASVLALIVLLVGIVQLPGAVVTLPVIAYMWTAGDGSEVSNTIFTIYLLIAGSVDGVLKPLLLGRGVDAPMPVILIGALGGMAVAGLIGLFLGAILLTLGYVIFMDWVEDNDDAALADSAQADSAQQSSASE